MPTINQLVKKKRVSKKIGLNKSPALLSSPQKYGTCLSIFTKTPRKPNSALRKVAKVRLANSKVITVFIPGEGHNISRFSDILVTGRRIRDLPGIKYGALRGKLDLGGVAKKKNGRSKYGSKRDKSQKEIKSINLKSKTSTLRKKREYSRFLRKGINSLLFKKGVVDTSLSLESFKGLLAYSLHKQIKASKIKRKVRLDRNTSLSIEVNPNRRPKSLKKTWVETKNLISGIKKSISKTENLRRLSKVNSKKISMKQSSGKGSQNHYELLEVSQTLRVIRVLDLKTNKVLRYSF